MAPKAVSTLPSVTAGTQKNYQDWYVDFLNGLCQGIGSSWHWQEKLGHKLHRAREANFSLRTQEGFLEEGLLSTGLQNSQN